MDIPTYKVVLLLDTELNSMHNPKFLFKSIDLAFQQIETFTSQGYAAAMLIMEGD